MALCGSGERRGPSIQIFEKLFDDRKKVKSLYTKISFSKTQVLFFVISVSCQQGDFEQNFQFWALGRPKNVNYSITICSHWCEIPVQKTLGTIYFTTSDTLEIRQIPSPFLVPTGPSSETSGEHEKTHEKWRYYPWNEIKAWFFKEIVTDFLLKTFSMYQKMSGHLFSCFES